MLAFGNNFNELDDVFDFFESRTNFEKTQLDSRIKREYRLNRMEHLCSVFGNPQNSCKIIHIAGSKGKGSTAAYIAALLKESGNKTGVYSSPHLIDYRERFTIPDMLFPEETAWDTACSLLKGLPEAEASLNGESPATTFELLTLFGFMLFNKLKCDTIVLECGLGGRLDATNIVSVPKIAVITPIEMEHAEILGPKLTDIAREKAGIFKSDSIAWTADQFPTVRRELRRVAKQKNIQLNELYAILKHIHQLDDFCWELQWRNGCREIIELSMGGRMQAENAALALTVVRGMIMNFPAASVRSLKKVVLPGRFELIEHEPPVVLDGAHTPASIMATARAFCSISRGYDPPVLLFGCAKDKDYRKMARILGRHGFNHVIVSTPGTFKPSDPIAVKTAFEKNCTEVELILSPSEAWKRARELAASERGILVTGSFYFAGEIAKIIALQP